jgi:methylenetetrahydrofolate dehydrogenase (NADP+)/methenyltetrahydrofolate cyclohydrolase
VTQILDGKAVAAKVRERVAAEVNEIVAAGRRQPALATVLVGDDPASKVYVANKNRQTEEVGMRSVHHELPAETSQDELLDLVHRLGADPEIDGILVQLPVPDQIDPAAVVAAINPDKDVDGLTPVNAGLLASGTPNLVPCTPAGVIELLDAAGVEIEGANAVVVGRSNLVGRPVASLLLGRNATVTIAHSRTRDLAGVCREADILIAAVGVPELIGRNHVKPGAAVIDVGINRTEAGLVGDVNRAEVEGIAGVLTPVPGGVGPMTIAMLLQNTLVAARRAL